jgi:hypothetical protein
MPLSPAGQGTSLGTQAHGRERTQQRARPMSIQQLDFGCVTLSCSRLVSWGPPRHPRSTSSRPSCPPARPRQHPLLPFVGLRGLQCPGCSGTATPTFSPSLLPGSGGCRPSAQAAPLFFSQPPGASSPPPFIQRSLSTPPLHPTPFHPGSISSPFLDFPRSNTIRGRLFHPSHLAPRPGSPPPAPTAVSTWQLRPRARPPLPSPVLQYDSTPASFAPLGGGVWRGTNIILSGRRTRTPRHRPLPFTLLPLCLCCATGGGVPFPGDFGVLVHPPGLFLVEASLGGVHGY